MKARVNNILSFLSRSTLLIRSRSQQPFTQKQLYSTTFRLDRQEQQQNEITVISRNIIYQRANPQLSSPESSQPPPLVLLFAWAIAKERHLEKFRNFWLSRSFDVLTVRTPFWELAFPGSVAPGNAHQVINFLASQIEDLPKRKIIAQGCSLGAYSLTTFVDQLRKLQKLNKPDSSSQRVEEDSVTSKNNTEKSASTATQIESAIAGVIFDSPGVWKALHIGASHVIFERPLARVILRNAIYAYYRSNRKLLWDRLQRIGRLQAEHPLRVPLLVLYSRDDEIVSADLVDELIEEWKQLGSSREGESKCFTVHSKCWERSEHVTHLRNFPEEYGAEVDRFRAFLGI